jgi:hypothetical protein
MTSRGEVTGNDQVEQPRKAAKLMTREELPELRPFTLPNMDIDPDQVVFAKARYREAEDALGTRGKTRGH